MSPERTRALGMRCAPVRVQDRSQPILQSDIFKRWQQPSETDHAVRSVEESQRPSRALTRGGLAT